MIDHMEYNALPSARSINPISGFEYKFEHLSPEIKVYSCIFGGHFPFTKLPRIVHASI